MQIRAKLAERASRRVSFHGVLSFSSHALTRRSTLCDQTAASNGTRLFCHADPCCIFAPPTPPSSKTSCLHHTLASNLCRPIPNCGLRLCEGSSLNPPPTYPNPTYSAGIWQNCSMSKLHKTAFSHRLRAKRGLMAPPLCAMKMNNKQPSVYPGEKSVSLCFFFLFFFLSARL